MNEEELRDEMGGSTAVCCLIKDGFHFVLVFIGHYCSYYAIYMLFLFLNKEVVYF